MKTFRSGSQWIVLTALIGFTAMTVFIPAAGAETGQPGFLNQLEVKSPEQISALTDKQLSEEFIDATVEIEAHRLFNESAGITPKQYESYKTLLKYRIYLLQEFDRREIDTPRIN